MMRGIAQTQQRDRGTVCRLTLPVLTLLVVPLILTILSYHFGLTRNTPENLTNCIVTVLVTRLH